MAKHPNYGYGRPLVPNIRYANLYSVKGNIYNESPRPWMYFKETLASPQTYLGKFGDLIYNW